MLLYHPTRAHVCESLRLVGAPFRCTTPQNVAIFGGGAVLPLDRVLKERYNVKTKSFTDIITDTASCRRNRKALSE